MDVSSQLYGSGRLIRGERGLAVHYMVTGLTAIIEGDSGRKVSISEADSISYCEKGHVNTCLIMNGYRDKAV
jgi:hypothetical protein